MNKQGIVGEYHKHPSFKCHQATSVRLGQVRGLMTNHLMILLLSELSVGSKFDAVCSCQVKV